ncbi:type II secretion system F family protein [Paenibacillus abyssi]|uniref:Secretion system protein n=1 Tax=Paenibacillus abyssi TaxID=1340531 RepID=A0A917FQV5_9BACL|nr:type II secretion system F family protein [Paenibacillus abyssi]GGG00518.1 secretion system protein [Paenibacillus abyssi]
MKWIIVLLFACTLFLLITASFQMLFSSERRTRKRLTYYLSLHDQRTSANNKFQRVKQFQQYTRNVRGRLISKRRSESLALFLARAGAPLRPEDFMLIQWGTSAAGAAIFYLLFGKIIFGLIGFVIGLMLPLWWVRKKQRDRLNGFNDSLQDMITTVIGSLKAGFSFAQSLKIVAEDSESPMKEEIELVLREMQYGSTMEAALQQLQERMPSEDLDLLIQSILIQRQIGGNLAVILETIVQMIRDRNKIQRQLRTLTAQGRLSGLVIGALPIGIGIFIYLIQPDYIESLFLHPFGIVLLIYGSISGVIGFAFIRKLTRIEV